MHVGLYRKAHCAPLFCDLSLYNPNKGQDCSWISFPNNFWFQLARAQRVLWSKTRSHTFKKDMTEYYIKYRFWANKRIGRAFIS
jgi:hypothetical protein